jgi:hypothetical protein
MQFLIIAVLACAVFSCTQVLGQTSYLTKNDIAYCEESHEHYKLLGDYQFLEREKRTMEARVCVHLYYDPVWSYSGADRLDKLLKRGNYYVDVEIEQSRQNAKTGVISQEKPSTDLQKAQKKITDLEKKWPSLRKRYSKRTR